VELKVQARSVLGKKVKQLRRAGVVPANIYGKGLDSVAIQVAAPELKQLLLDTGRNAIIQVSVADKGKAASHDVMVRDIARDPVTGGILHVDFFKVQMSQPIQVEVAISLVGLAPAVDLGLGTLVHGVNALHVEGLPAHLPSFLTLDVSGMAEAHSVLYAREVTLPPGLTLASDPEQVVASIAGRRGVEAAAAEGEPTTEGAGQTGAENSEES
jgi:large subunit ribosomal protein L25